MQRTRVVIIGGGLSGLAAAVYLLKDGANRFDVVVLESQAQAGGQAASWLHDGRVEEVGIHLDFLPWYTNKVRLYEDVDSPLGLVQTDGNYYVCNGTTGRIDKLLAGAELGTTGLRATFGALKKLSVGLAKFPGLMPGERWWLARFIWKVLRMRTGEADRYDIPVDEMLRRFGATEALVRQLSLATVTIQGLRISDASAASFIKFLKASYGASSLQNAAFFNRPTGEALIDPLVAYIRAHGGRVYLNETVRAINAKEGRAYVVRTDDRWLRCDAVVTAMPGYLVPPLIPEQYRDRDVFGRIAKLTSAQVTTLTLWYRERWFPDHNVYISNRDGVIFDAVADKSRHWARPDQSGSIIQVLIDADGDIAHWSDDRIVAQSIMDLMRFFPQATYPRGNPQAWKLRRHHSIYCETTPGYWSLVPRSHRTPINNLYLAGDYTAGLYHYGMESAVISGKEVANLLRREAGLAEHPNVPVAFLPFTKT